MLVSDPVWFGYIVRNYGKNWYEIHSTGCPRNLPKGRTISRRECAEESLFSLCQPHWTGKGDCFWYLHQTPEKKTFYFVNPDTELHDKAFDHRQVALALSAVTGEMLDENHLPFDSIAIEENGEEILFSYKGILWAYHLPNKECHATYSTRRSSLHVSRSPQGGWDLSLKEGNLILRSCEDGVQWDLTTDAEEGLSYGTSPESNLRSIQRHEQDKLTPPIALWSPDGTKFLTHRLDQRKVKKLHLIKTTPEDGSFRPQMFSYRYPFVGDRALAQQELLLFDVEKKRWIPIQNDPLLVGYLSLIELGWAWWSHDGKKIYFLDESRGAKSLSLCQADVETGRVKVLIKEESKEYVEPSQLAPWPCFAKELAKTREILWLSERDGWAHLYLHDQQTGKCTQQVTHGPFDVLEVVGVDEEEQWIYFLACGKESHRDPYYPHLYRMDYKGNHCKLLTTQVASHEVFLSPTKRYIVDNFSTINMETLPHSVVIDHEGKKILDLLFADLQPLFSKGWHPPERFTVKAANGETPLYGMLFFPSTFDSQLQYPVIDFIYPGPQLIVTPKAFTLLSKDSPKHWPGPWMPQALAELGFIVVTLDARGTPLRSREFHHASYGHLDEGGALVDHVSGLKELATERFYMDLDRVGIIGHAAGGYAAARALLLFPQFYKAAVSSGGDHNLLSYLAYWGEKYHGLYDADRYAIQSNSALAKHLEGDLLLVHGEIDANVHPCGTLQFVDALIQENKDFEFLLFPNESDGCYDNPYFIRKVWDFFVRHLLKQEPPKGYRMDTKRIQ